MQSSSKIWMCDVDIALHRNRFSLQPPLPKIENISYDVLPYHKLNPCDQHAKGSSLSDLRARVSAYYTSYKRVTTIFRDKVSIVIDLRGSLMTRLDRRWREATDREHKKRNRVEYTRNNPTFVITQEKVFRENKWQITKWISATRRPAEKPVLTNATLIITFISWVILFILCGCCNSHW